jgi:diguanylate cyclase (GGDEF)-like protein
MPDPLTGIMNRGGFEESFKREMKRFQRYGETFVLIMFDLDHFKTINDTYGHEAGDRALVGIAKSVAKIIRANDVFARFGGEEFVVMMPYSDYSHGCVVAEKIRKNIEETQFLYEKKAVPITVSVGLTMVNATDRNFRSMYQRVDHLLYQAKKMGKNRIVSDMPAQGSVPGNPDTPIHSINSPL